MLYSKAWWPTQSAWLRVASDSQVSRSEAARHKEAIEELQSIVSYPGDAPSAHLQNSMVV